MAQKLRSLQVKTKEKGGKITTAGRRGLGKGQFALPDGDRPGVKGRYPIDTAGRARNALARVSQHGSPEEKKKVRTAVKGKYPSIGQGGERTMVSPEGIQGAKMKRHGKRHAKR